MQTKYRQDSSSLLRSELTPLEGEESSFAPILHVPMNYRLRILDLRHLVLGRRQSFGSKLISHGMVLACSSTSCTLPFD